MNIGPVNIDFTYAQTFFQGKSTFEAVLIIIANAGWIILVYLFLFIMLFLWKEYKEEQYKKDWKWVLLAIDVPPENMQTPKAVEQMFSHLAGAYEEPNIADKFRSGFKQRWFSFEIISIEGYIQFLVRTEERFRDLLEGAIYAQYPGAEIIEVEDYTEDVPDKFPSEEYDMWAGDFGLSESFSFPIRTYEEFEHKLFKDENLKDPMGTFLESFSRIGAGEQVWFQILLEPTSNAWKEKVIRKIKDLVGDMVSMTSSKRGGGMGSLMNNEPKKAFSEFGSQLFGNTSSESTTTTVKDTNKTTKLTPGQSKILEAMERKITKIGFKTKMRAVYVARKEVFKPERSVNAIIGAMGLYSIPSSNSIVVTSSVSTNYFLKESRNHQKKTKAMSAYKKRKMKVGGNPFVFNIEELATIWHFPLSYVKTPLLQRTQGKRAEPPSGLPIENIPFVDRSVVAEDGSVKKKNKGQNKTFVTDAGDVAYFSSDEEYG